MTYHPAFSFEVVEIGEAYQIRFEDSFLCTHGSIPKVLSHPNKSFLEELVAGSSLLAISPRLPTIHQ